MRETVAAPFRVPVSHAHGYCLFLRGRLYHETFIPRRDVEAGRSPEAAVALRAQQLRIRKRECGLAVPVAMVLLTPEESPDGE